VTPTPGKGTYSGAGRIQKELQALNQGEKSAVEYVSELKKLWSDLDYYDPVELECPKCIEKFNKWTEQRRVRDFLNGLHPKYENRRAGLVWKRQVAKPGTSNFCHCE
jgi:hypothetical protein